MKKTIFSLCLILLSFTLIAQDSKQSQEPLPSGYNNITLGMTLDQAKEALKSNPQFGYHGDRDVSLVPYQNQVLIETDADKGYGTIFLTNCWFQFYKDKLYIITINVNTDKMDYYSMFVTLKNKYGEPTSLDPEKSIWKNDSITMILEKPLSIKYIDNSTYDEIIKQSNVEISGEELSREMFLEEF